MYCICMYMKEGSLVMIIQKDTVVYVNWMLICLLFKIADMALFILHINHFILNKRKHSLLFLGINQSRWDFSAMWQRVHKGIITPWKPWQSCQPTFPVYWLCLVKSKPNVSKCSIFLPSFLWCFCKPLSQAPEIKCFLKYSRLNNMNVVSCTWLIPAMLHLDLPVCRVTKYFLSS